MTYRISRSGENKTITPADLLSATVTTESGCMEWQRRRSPRGYGEIFVGNRKHRTHRLMTFLIYGLPEANQHALHSCDNPPCINPDHLRWGTHAENMAERDAKNRHQTPSGEAHWNASITADQVKIIRKMWADGAKVKQIADTVGCSRGVVAPVVYGWSWKHIQ
jgi:hypothetical protein